MPGRIFISYRRADSQYATDRIYDRLSAHFGADRVFMDIDDIPLGVNFRIYIDQQVSTSEIVLAVIGDHWLSATDPEGNLRLDNPGDFVRLELEATLKQGIKLIPLFIGDVKSIPSHRLPESLRELPMLNATRIRRGTDFEGDIDKLIRGVERIFAQQEATRLRNTAALEELKQSTANIVGQLSGFEALLIQEMRKRAQLEKHALEIETQIKETLHEPGKQLHADVPALRRQVDSLRDEIVELSFQIEERKQANKLKEARVQADAARRTLEKDESDRFALEKAEADGKAKEKAEEEQIAKQRTEARKIAKGKAEASRIAKEKAEADRIAKQQAKAERLKKQQAAVQKRRSAIADFRAMLGKIPFWAWGTGLLMVLLVIAGLVYGPSLLNQLSASQPTMTVQPTGTSQVVTGPQVSAGFLDWMEVISRSTPDYIEDFSTYSYPWQREIAPGMVIADYVTDTGELVIADDPAELRDYSINVGIVGDFQLQFELSPRIFTTGTPLMVTFMRDNEGKGGFFRLNRDGTWDIRVESGGKEEKLDAGEMAPLSSDETYIFRLIDKEGYIAVLVNGELLSYVENPIQGEGDIQIYFQAYKAFEVVYDNILLWDLSDDEYLVDPPEDQAYAFSSPIRQYLSDTFPTFEEDFENYQPYWDEMQVDYSQTKSVSLSESVREGTLQLNAIEGVDSGIFGLVFPQISGRAFALQFDFNFMDPMASGSILTAAVQTAWENSEFQGGYSPFCDFNPHDEQLGCGLFQIGISELTEITSAGFPYPDIYSPHTLLVIFYDGQYTSFLDGYITAYAEGLEFFNQEISINVGTNEDRQKFDAAVDNIKFWNLDGVVYQPTGETGELQLVKNPIREYLVSTEPTFCEDFETPQDYWNGVTVYQDDQQGTSLAERVSDGVVRLDSREEEMINNYWDLTFPQFQQSSNFALKFDVNLVEATGINAFISSASQSTYIFVMGISDGGLEIAFNKESGEGDIEAEPEQIISKGTPYDSQTATLLMISYQSRFAIFVDDLFLGFADGVEDIAQNPEIVIFVPAENDKTIVELDNIQYWNLDGAEIDTHQGITSKGTGLDYEYLLEYIYNELSPTFKDDFSQANSTWGETSEGFAISSLINNGELVISEDAEDVVPGLTFPTNGLFDAQNFFLEFEYQFLTDASFTELGIQFRSTSDLESGYRIVTQPSGGWRMLKDGANLYLPVTERKSNHLRLLVMDQYAVVLFDEQLPYITDNIDTIGTSNRIWFIEGLGSEAVFDNVQFWNLDGGEIDITEFMSNN